MTITEKIAAIKALPSQLNTVVAGLSDQQLDTPYREGGWTPRQVVHHLADSHMNAFIRMKLILAEENPTLKPYDENVWAAMADSKIAVGPSLSLVEGLHDRMTTLLENVNEQDWSRTAHHPENGEMTLGGLLDTYAAHGARHVGQIRGLRERMGW